MWKWQSIDIFFPPIEMQVGWLLNIFKRNCNFLSLHFSLSITSISVQNLIRQFVNFSQSEKYSVKCDDIYSLHAWQCRNTSVVPEKTYLHMTKSDQKHVKIRLRFFCLLLKCAKTLSTNSFSQGFYSTTLA